jgi:C_GCAxxG_C_C family probable redox protein
MGRLGETCGVVAGALMIIGLKYGASSANDKEAKEKTYGQTVIFINEFKSGKKSVLCRDLLGFDLLSEDRPESEKTRIISERCPAYVQTAAMIIDRLLKD